MENKMLKCRSIEIKRKLSYRTHNAYPYTLTTIKHRRKSVPNTFPQTMLCTDSYRENDCYSMKSLTNTHIQASILQCVSWGNDLLETCSGVSSRDQNCFTKQSSLSSYRSTIVRYFNSHTNRLYILCSISVADKRLYYSVRCVFFVIFAS